MRLELLGKKDLPLLEFIFIICLFAIYLLPSVSVGATMILVLLMAYCGYLMLVDRDMFFVVLKPLILVFALAFFYTLLTDTQTIAQNVSNRDLKRFMSKTYQYLSLYFPAILFVRVNKTATKKQKKYLALIGIALMIYVIITTWVFLIENPNATREWASFEENSAQGVANYYFIYTVPIIISAISILLFRSTGTAKLISLAAIIGGILFLVSAQYTLSILISIIGLLIQIFRNLRSVVSKILFVMSVSFMVLFLPEILQFAMEKIPSEQVTIRLGEIYDFLVGRGTGGYNLNGRLTLYGDTIKVFFESPISGNRNLDFDGHATFLTVLSDTGLLGGIPFYVLLATACKSVRSQLRISRSQFNVIIIMFVMMGLTNPVHASMPLGLATWFLAPLTIQMIMKEDYRNETAMEN